jgi:hypothetical protein
LVDSNSRLFFLFFKLCWVVIPLYSGLHWGISCHSHCCSPKHNDSFFFLAAFSLGFVWLHLTMTTFM